MYLNPSVPWQRRNTGLRPMKYQVLLFPGLPSSAMSHSYGIMKKGRLPGLQDKFKSTHNIKDSDDVARTKQISTSKYWDLCTRVSKMLVRIYIQVTFPTPLFSLRFIYRFLTIISRPIHMAFFRLWSLYSNITELIIRYTPAHYKKGNCDAEKDLQICHMGHCWKITRKVLEPVGFETSSPTI